MVEKTPNPHIHPFIPSELRPSDESALETSLPLAVGASKEDMRKRAYTALEGTQLGFPDGRPGGTRMVFTNNPNVHWTVLEGEAVLLNLDNGIYYTLNRVGTVIWEFFTGHQSFERILASICERFEVTREQAREDLEALVTRLHQEGLIVTKEE